MDGTLLTRKEAAQHLKIKPVTLKKYEKKGLIKPACWLSNRPRYSIDDLNNLLTIKPGTNGN